MRARATCCFLRCSLSDTSVNPHRLTAGSDATHNAKRDQTWGRHDDDFSSSSTGVNIYLPRSMRRYGDCVNGGGPSAYQHSPPRLTKWSAACTAEVALPRFLARCRDTALVRSCGRSLHFESKCVLEIVNEFSRRIDLPRAGWIRYIVALLGVAIAYAAAAEMGLAIPFPVGTLAPFWPPAAVSLTMLLLFGAELFPAVFLADIAVSLLHHYPTRLSLAIAAANTIEPLVGVALIRWIGGFSPDLRRLRDVAVLILCGGVAGTTAGAVCWVIFRAIAFGIPMASQAHAGFMWIRGDFVSIVLLSPLLLVWSRPFSSLLPPRRFAEATIAFASLVIVNALVFSKPELATSSVYAVEHMAVPFVIWLALRFDTHGATLGAYTTAMMAARNTILGNGPFALEGLFGLHVFLAVLSVTALIIAASICEHRQLETTLRHREEQLAGSEKRYRDLFENAEDFIVTLDLSGRFTSANHAVLRSSGYMREELLQKTFLDVVAPASAELAWSSFKDVLAGKKRTQNMHFEMMCEDGRTLWVEVNSRVIKQGQATIGIQSIGRDVTWRKRMEQELLQAQKMDALGRLAGGVAHDFNNLLGVILGYSDLMLTESPVDEMLRQRIAEIRKAGRRAAEVTRQLLAFSRKQILQSKVVEVDSIVKDTTSMLLRLLGEDIELITRPASAPTRVFTDPAQMQQLIINLAINARDAMPKGGKLILETSTVELEAGECDAISKQMSDRRVLVRPGLYVVLVVTDTGLGMDEETRSRIFEPFFTTKPLGEGTGLGLSTVYGFVKQCGGYIWVYSEPGHGTTFKIYLPLVDRHAQTVEPEEPRNLPRGSETILLVEDEQSLRELNGQLMRTLGYTVIEAAYGPQALELASAHAEKIDLLLTDVVMPGMSGRELAERLSLSRPETKVLYMSGYTDNMIVHHGVLQPGIAFLQKPFTRDILAGKLREVLNSRHSAIERSE